MPDQKIPEITPLQAYEILKSDKSAVLIDVRTAPEFEYVGHPPDAINIPWHGPPGFVDKVRRSLDQIGGGASPEAMTVLAICRSGKRSMAAASELAAAGFTKVFNVAEGFEGDLDAERHRGRINGWRFHGLPWEQG
jgi:rhodanese-related sulfurtransferase